MVNSAVAKYRAASAISCAVAILGMGVCFRKKSMNSGVRLFTTASVAVMPGHTMLQRTLERAACTAVSLVS
mgnify:CR=1 FL=1